MKKVQLEVEPGVTIYASTGRNGYDQPDRMSSLQFYRAFVGSVVELNDHNYYFNIATYSLKYDLKYVYTYAYEPESSWTTYNMDLNGTTYRQEKYMFQENCYFRVCLKRVDGKGLSQEEADNINNILSYHSEDLEHQVKPYFIEEVDITANSILERSTDSSLKIAILTDSHYTVNGTWEDTAYNIRSVHEKVGFDAIVHLGDLTDGLLSPKMTSYYSRKVIGDLLENEIPLYVVPGNHDANYFQNNSAPMTEKEQSALYLNHSEKYIHRRKDRTFYYVDNKDLLIRMIFLNSFAYEEKERYGYSLEQLDWLQDILQSADEGFSYLIFSHVPPLGALHYWSEDIRNGENLVSLLESFQRKSGKKIISLIHGHNHADAIYEEREFPIVSIGCAKLEYFTEYRPPGVNVAERTRDAVTQDLWDSMIVIPHEKRIELVRFGAGEDRRIVYE